MLVKSRYFVGMGLKVGTVKAINTGMGVAFLKATGMLYPKEKRLFEDPFALKLLPSFHRFIIFLMRRPKIFNSLMRWRERTTPGLVGWMFCRFRYIDDVLKDNIKTIETVVNLGSGMDCRAYYIPGVKNIRYYEVDHPSVVKKKKAKIKKILGVLPNHVVYVPVDFEKQNPETELIKAGYKSSYKTLFIWEGVTQYISEQANAKTFGFIERAVVGSKIVFTYVPKSFIEGKNISDNTKNMYKWMVKRFSLWIFGINPKDIGDYLSKYSLHLIEDIGSKYMQERYLKPVNLGLTLFDIERIALAEVKN